MAIFLRALALQSYRGIGTEMQKMTAFQDFNFFIGANNAGKSSVLDFLSRHLVPSARSDQSSGGLTALEQHAGGTLGPPLMAFGVPLEEFYRNAAKRITTKRPDIEGSLREV